MYLTLGKGLMLTQRPVDVHKASVAKEAMYQLQSEWVLGPGAKFGHAFNCMLSGIIHVY